MITQKGEKLTGQFGYSSSIARIYIHTYLATTEYPDRRQLDDKPSKIFYFIFFHFRYGFSREESIFHWDKTLKSNPLGPQSTHHNSWGFPCLVSKLFILYKKKKKNT